VIRDFVFSIDLVMEPIDKNGIPGRRSIPPIKIKSLFNKN
jgi:hypothetical protein